MKLPTLYHASYYRGNIVYSPSKVKFDKPMKRIQAPQWLIDMIDKERTEAYDRGYAKRGAEIRQALGCPARIGNMPG